jgi:uncharacterized protein (DUF697 family)/tellurite resistance protein
MNTDTQRALLGIAVMAAFADGEKVDAEREDIRRLAASLGDGSSVAPVVQDVLLKRLTLASASAALGGQSERQLAYEVALGVCEADGSKSPAEAQFLAQLKATLGLGQDAAMAHTEAQVDALAGITDAPQDSPAGTATPAALAQAAAAGAPIAASTAAAAAAATQVMLTEAEAQALDKSILNHAILCGALELLPQSWASMAIIPLQVKMVYGVGQKHGIALDQGHIKEFIATAGVGLTSQYLEQFGRRLVGGLLGKVAGGLGRGLGSAATGMAMSFATTYALGQLARRYYGGGRQMSTQMLKDTFNQLLGPAKQLQQQYLPQIQQRARTLDASQIVNLVRQPLA